ncbi:RpiR family transcriptional regulator, partial [Verminephrobacter sp. Larva24]
GPLARTAEATLIVQDSATFGFRALTATMGLAQSLFVALAYRLEISSQPTSTGRHRGALRAVAQLPPLLKTANS